MADIATRTVTAELAGHQGIDLVRFVLFSEAVRDAFLDALAR